ncbi:MAG: DinB family protein [Bacteroidota bacterium]
MKSLTLSLTQLAITITRQLINQLQKIYNGKAWHGPNILETLSTITSKETTERIGSSNNIAELLHHIYAWRIFVIKRFSGEHEFEVSDEFNFQRFETIDEKAWKHLKEQLAHSQEQLVETIEKFDPEKLSKEVSNRDYTYLDLLHGIIHHDLYHLGQIVLLRK